jgi:hypothetical protein
MNVKRILVLGGGFAGLWSAVGAVRKLDELGYGPDAVEVMLVNRDGYHNMSIGKSNGLFHRRRTRDGCKAAAARWQQLFEQSS